MSFSFIGELTEFLARAKLSTYCINAFVTLQNSSNITAKEISKFSGVPIGRIYEILDELENKRMIEISDSRPKTYRTVSLNRAIYNLIVHQTKEDKRRSAYLYEQAKILESKMYSSEAKPKVEASEIFYSTVLEPKKIGFMFINSINESQEELLLNGFINEDSLKLIPLADKMVESVSFALDRGVKAKLLLSFEYDNRIVLKDQKLRDLELIETIKQEFKKVGLSTDRENFELKFTFKRFPNCYDIIDRKRIIMKLQNPSASWQVFACINIIDPLLAEELREKYFGIWRFDTIS
jgi:sugar-specific transcriptional regulator TrmB